MKSNNKIFLPGTDKQVLSFLKTIEIKNKSVLILGSGSEEIAKIFHNEEAKEIYLITEDENSLVQSRFLLSKIKEINVRLMDYENTDFNTGKFDIVYSQGSTGTKYRNKIIKEIKRIIKPEGVFCVGEIVSLTEGAPSFVKDIWVKSDLAPLNRKAFINYYLSKGFEMVLEQDLSGTLKDFYSRAKKLLSETSKDFSNEEIKNHKQIIKMYTHEANAYLELGGDKYIGYGMLILKAISNLKED